MTPENRRTVNLYGKLPQAETLLRPEDFHWSKLFAWDRGKTFRILTPIHAANYGGDWSKNFTKAYGPAVVMPMTFMGKGLGFGARAIKEKKFTANFFQSPGFYSASTCFNEPFVYGTPILVVEGVLDAEVASLAYPWTVGALTASLSEPQAFLLSHLTNTVVLGLDNDEAGEKGAFYSTRHLKKWGVKTTEVKPSGVKDWGDLISRTRDGMQDELNRIVLEMRTKGIIRG